MCDIVGYTKDELVEMTFQDITHPEDLETDLDHVRQVLADEIKTYSMEKRYIRKDGAVVWVNLTVSLMRDTSGEPAFFVSVVEDISERKSMERSLRQMSKVFMDAADPIVIEDLDGTIIDMNTEAEQTYGWSREELVGKTIHTLVPKESLDLAFKLRELSKRGEGVRNIEGLRRTKSGEIIPILLSLSVLKDEEGKQVGIASICKNLGEQKRVEEELKESRASFTSIVENSREAVLILDAEGLVVYMNPSSARFLNTSKNKLLGMPFGRPLSHGEVAEIEVVRPEGDEGIAEMRVEPTQWLGREATMIKLHDITERKRSEEESRFKTRLLEGVNKILHYTLTSPGVRDVAQCSLSTIVELTESRFGWIGEINEKGRIDTIAQSNSVRQDCRIQKERAPRLIEDMEVRGIWSAVLKTKQSQIINHPPSHRDSVGVPEGYPPIESFLGVPLKRSAETFGVIALANKEGGYTSKDIESVEAVSIAFVEALDRRGAQDRLQESEERYRSLFDESIDGVYEIGRDGRLFEADQAFLNMFGYPKDEMIDRNIRHVYVESADRDKFVKNIEGKGFVKNYPVRLRKKDGVEIQCELSTTLRMDQDGNIIGYRGIIRDVTDRVRMEHELRRSEERFRLLGESSPVGISIIQDNSRVYLNPSLVKMFGWESDEDILDAGIEDLYCRDSREDIARLITEAEKAERIVVGRDLQGRRKDGATFDVSIWLIGTEYLGKSAVLAFVLDESETKSLQAQLVRAQKMESLGTLAGGIAHDFNNLLTVIQGYSELLLVNTKEEDPDYTDLQVINNTAKRGADLVRRILTFSRQVEIEKRCIDPNEELQRAQKLLKRTIPKMIQIELRPGKDMKKVYADPGQIEQILLNLAVNASHAMPDGGELTIQTEDVYLDEEYCAVHLEAQPGEYVLLTVSDTGSGMQKEITDHIFEPFFTTKKPGEGTGLGLSVVFGIVRAHGGHITCYSEPGIGTIFKIYLPVQYEEGESFEPAIGVQIPELGAETILLVDDEEGVRDLGKRMLGAAGYSVLTASNGNEALKVYRKRRTEISLIILDLIMPELGGKDCLKELLKLDPQIKVLISSGFAPDDATREIVQTESKGFIDKPFKRTEMLRMIRNVLDM
jgi:two-component system cell cycle sensor histidine kinase/response regulator CckA